MTITFVYINENHKIDNKFFTKIFFSFQSEKIYKCPVILGSQKPETLSSLSLNKFKQE